MIRAAGLPVAVLLAVQHGSLRVERVTIDANIALPRDVCPRRDVEEGIIVANLPDLAAGAPEPVIQRQVVNSRYRDIEILVRAFGPKQGRVGGDGDRLRGRAYFEFDIDRVNLRDLNLNAALGEFLEPRHLNAHRIHSGGHFSQCVAPGPGRDGGVLGLRLRIHCEHVRVGYNRAYRIADRSRDAPAVSLREGSDREQSGPYKDQPQFRFHTHNLIPYSFLPLTGRQLNTHATAARASVGAPVAASSCTLRIPLDRAFASNSRRIP